MQAAFLISAKNFTEKQIGVLFLVFGLSQFLVMAPTGYLLDYSNNKINWVLWAGFLASLLTIVTAVTAAQDGTNMGLMIVWKVLQGAISAIIPSGFNSITLGIVGSSGFTHQVSRNRMMNHVGTALIVALGSLIAYFLYPNIGALFVVSPLSAIGLYYHLHRIKPTHVNRDAARCLIIESPTMEEYEHLDEAADWDMGAESDESESTPAGSDFFSETPADTPSMYIPPHELADSLMPPSKIRPRKSERSFVVLTPAIDEDRVSDHPDRQRHLAPSKPGKVRSYGSQPSFHFGWKGRRESSKVDVAAEAALEAEEKQQNQHPLKARTPGSVLRDPTLGIFSLIVFFFHLANSSVLPLVMQSLSLQDPQAGILLSGLCILIAQCFMAFFAKLCGDYSPKWGRKGLSLVGLASLTVRCFLLTLLLTAQENVDSVLSENVTKSLILSTQLLDSVGAGIFGTLHILITNDISGGTGRFSLMLGVTTGAMCLGGTVSGYIGQAIAQDYGYPFAFTCLGMMSLVPFFMFLFWMPETLPDYVKPKRRRRRLITLLKKLNEQSRNITSRANPFRREPPLNDVVRQGLDPRTGDGHNNMPRSRTIELV
jgi:MFS family permease